MSRGHHQNDDRHMTLREHVQELSRRFMLLVSILLIASSLVYVYRSSIIPIVLQPMAATFGEQKLMYLNPAGGFNFIFLISIYAGLAAVAPFAVQQLYAFIRPTLPKAAQRLSAKLLLMSFALMVAGILFGYYIAVPGALKFLAEFAGDYVSAALTADSYLNFLVAYTLGLGLLFQLPFILIIGHYIKPFTPSGLMKSERWAIVLIFMAAAIITPTPDPVNMLIVALPILLIYQIGVAVVLTSIYKKHRHERRLKVAVPAIYSNDTSMPFVVAMPTTTSEMVVSLVEEAPISTIYRSIDGFARSRQQAPPALRVPVRQRNVCITQPPARQVISNSHDSAHRRYIDGISVLLPQ